MRAQTFSGGIHPEGSKELTCFKSIEVMPVPETLYLPLSMHWNKPCEAVAKPGDEVLVGQLIADSTEPIPVPIHSPVSGKVVKIEDHESVSGGKKPVIVIKNDYKDTLHPSVRPIDDWRDMSSDELIDIIRSKGMVGMGGAAFPTHIKLRSVRGSLDTLIINAAECEPYLTCDHRMLLERYESLIYGMQILMKVLNQDKAYLAFEANKLDCEPVIRSYLDTNRIRGIEIVVLKNKYPQGYEKQLIKVITGREVPVRGLPSDVGCAIFNTQTTSAIGTAFRTGLPLIKRVLTISGDAIANPKNLEVRLGTTLREVIDTAGGFSKEPKQIIVGGPMMGFPQYSTDAVVVKATNGILAFGDIDKKPQEPICIRCGKCVSVCPMHLMPVYINMFATARDYDGCERYSLRDCMECGSCAYICPARVPLVENFRIAKQKLPRTPPAPPQKKSRKEGKKVGK